MVESFSTYYGEVPLQKKGLNVKFTLYLISRFVTNLILHRERLLQFSLMIRKFTLYLIPRFVTKLKLHRKGLHYSLIIRKFNLYYTPTVGAIFILHRRGIKITELCLVEIAEMHYLQWFEGDCFRP